MNEHIWWYLARATGIVAWALASAAVLWGMALSTRALGSKPRAPWLLDLHRYLGGLTVLSVLAHVGALMADSYVEFGPAEVLVPMATSWRPVAVALGIVGMYLLLAVELTSLVKRRLSKRIWRAIHLASYGVYVLATAHFVMAGTDASNIVARVALILSVSAGLFFFVYLLIGPGRAASVRSGPPREPRAERVPAAAASTTS